MAQQVTVRLNRGDATPWGFRLQGGKDFGTPLLIQKVNSGSLADQVGLVAGDAVIRINGQDVFELRHKDAQDVVVRAGNNFDVTVQRGGSTWQPSVVPQGALPHPNRYGNLSPVTKTSLAHNAPQNGRNIAAIGTGYNNAARPFNSPGPVKSIVNKQYNTPVGMYSDESIAETLSAQAEVLAGGVLGVNFKKNEKMYNSANSEVYKMLQEQANDPNEPEDNQPYWATKSHAIGGHYTPRSNTPSQAQHNSDERVGTPLQQKFLVPEALHRTSLPQPKVPQQLPTVIPDGVFVRIKDKNLHAECFKCATCGTSLKNQGYFHVHNKLYCDLHAKLAAASNPPAGAQGLAPIPIRPDKTYGASTISAALNARVVPSTNGSTHLISQPSNINYSSQKPFNYSQPPAAAPKSPSSYPPSAPNFAQPKPASNYGYNSGGINQSRQQNGQVVEIENISDGLFETTSNFTSQIETTEQHFASFNWPPNLNEDHCKPTASPLYVPPPETQHIISKPISKIETERRIAAAAAATTTQRQSTLTVSHACDLESCSADSYTSTNTATTSTTSDDQRNYQMYSNDSLLNQSLSDTDYQDFDISALQYHKMSICSSEVNEITGRRSVQECAGNISNSINTKLLIDTLDENSLRPSSPIPKLSNKVEFTKKVDHEKEQQQHEVQTDRRDLINFSSGTSENMSMSHSQATSIDDAFHHADKLYRQLNTPTIEIEDTSKTEEYSKVSTETYCEQKQLRRETNSKSFMTSLLTTAPSAPLEFLSKLPTEPVPLPEETVPYLPPSLTGQSNSLGENDSNRPRSPFLMALLTAPIEPYAPLNKETLNQFDDLPKPKEHLSMVNALTIASDCAYSPIMPQNNGEGPTMQFSISEPQYKAIETVSRNVEMQQIGLAHKVICEENGNQDGLFFSNYNMGAEETKEKEPSAFANVAGVRKVCFLPPKPEPEPEKPKPMFTVKKFVAVTPTNQNGNRFGYQTPHEFEHLCVKQDNQNTEEFLTEQKNENCNQNTEQFLTQQKNEQYHQNSEQFLTQQKNEQYHQNTEQFLTEQKNEQCQKKVVQQIKSERVTLTQPVPKRNPVFTGLHIPESIPTYQKKTDVLPSQFPQKPPASPTLRDNVPIAYLGAPEEDLDAQKSRFFTSSPTKQLIEEEERLKQKYEMKTRTTQFQTLDRLESNEHLCVPARPLTPSQINKPAPLLPYYQANLPIPVQYPATESVIFDPKSRSPSPNPEKCMAVGPPPNPRNMVTPTFSHEIDKKPITLVGFKNLSSYEDASKGAVMVQNIGTASLHQSAGSKNERIGNVNVNTNYKASQLSEQSKKEMQCSQTLNVGNAQIQRRTRVIEEHEHERKENTVEIRKSSVNVRSAALDINGMPRQGSVSQQVKQLTNTDQTRSIQRTQQVTQQKSQLKLSEQAQNVKCTKKVSIAKESEMKDQENQTYKFPVTPHISNPTDHFPVVSKSSKIRTKSEENMPNIIIGKPSLSSATQKSVKAKIDMFSSAQKQQKFNIDSIIENPLAPIPLTKPQLQHLKASEENSPLPCTAAPQKCCQLIQPNATSAFKPLPQAPKIPLDITSSSLPASRTSASVTIPLSTSSFKPFQSSKPEQNKHIPNVSVSDPSPASAGSAKGKAFGATSAPIRGRGTLNKAVGPGVRVPTCGCCSAQIRGPFITALGRIWAPDHFVCTTSNCRRPLQDIGFVEEKGGLHCEFCFEKFLAPTCSKCSTKVKGDCLNAMGRKYHPECFTCTYCGKLFGNNSFFLEEGEAYCEADWNELFTTKCFACGFPVEAGDRWVEALNNNYHSQCFNCSMCKKNLEGQSFFAKGGRPFCKNHAR